MNLVKLVIFAEIRKEVFANPVPAQFNPNSLRFSKSARWDQKSAAASNVPALQFAHGNATELSIEQGQHSLAELYTTGQALLTEMRSVNEGAESGVG